MYLLALLIALLCGQSHALYGGKEIEIESAAYQVSIHERLHLACGGSIVSKDYVLSVASCVDAFVENFKVHAGSNTIYSKDASIHDIVDIHRQNVNEPGNELILLRVKPSFHLDTKRQPIKLVNSEYKLKANESLHVSGYGYTNGFVPSNKLRSIDTCSTLLEDCVKRYDQKISSIFPGMMCSNGHDSCTGDTGNPIVLNDGKLVAVTSSKYSCGSKDQADVHILVARVVNWIHTIIENY